MSKNILITQGHDMQTPVLTAQPAQSEGEAFSALMASFQQLDLSGVSQTRHDAGTLAPNLLDKGAEPEESRSQQSMLDGLAELIGALSQVLDQAAEVSGSITDDGKVDAQLVQNDTTASLMEELAQLAQQLEQVAEALPGRDVAHSQRGEIASEAQAHFNEVNAEGLSANFATLSVMDSTPEDIGIQKERALSFSGARVTAASELQQHLARLTAQLQQLEQRSSTPSAQEPAASLDEAYAVESEHSLPSALTKSQLDAMRTSLVRLQQYLAQKESMMGDKPPVRQSGAQVLVDEHITQGAFAGKAKLGAEPSRLLDTLMQPGAMPGAMNSLRWQSALGEKPALNPMTRLQTALAAQVDGDGMLLQSEEGEEASQAQSGYSSRGMEGAASRGGSGHSVLAQSTLSLPVKHPQWGEQLAQRVLFLAQNNQQLAQIRLNPAHLGPIQIKMKLDQDQAVQVSLHAHHALTRDAIEQAVPRLKEMFAQQGLTLGDIQVQADAQGHAQAFAQMRREASAFGMQAGHTSESEDENSMVPVTQVRQDGLIDHFV